VKFIDKHLRAEALLVPMLLFVEMLTGNGVKVSPLLHHAKVPSLSQWSPSLLPVVHIFVLPLTAQKERSIIKIVQQYVNKNRTVLIS
jgi:hypothetical protein